MASHHKAPQGFLTFAKNSDTVNYLELAYVQALNIKNTQRVQQYAVVVDAATRELVTPEHKRVFDHVIVAESPGPFDAEAQAFWLSPFQETIKVESDLLFTRSIDHWWTAFRLRDVCLSTGCRNYQQEISTNRQYRRVFDDNALPDVYNGLMYWRFSQTARDFFMLATQIFSNWNAVSTELRNFRDQNVSTDVVFALAAQLLGPELCTIPGLDFINFVHMKPAINGHAESLRFTDAFVTEFDAGMIRVNNINQYHPWHYQDKQFINSEITEYYGPRIS
jgi:hypothetical protein